MKTFLLLIICCIGVSKVYSQDNLTEERQKLAFIAGSWTVEGSEKTYLEVCDWIQGNHLQCLSTDSETGVEKKAVSYLTYSVPEKVYVYYGLYSGGGTRTLRGQWINDRFVFEGKQKATDKITRYRVTMIPDNGRIDFREERSINNSEWQESAHFYYIPTVK